MRIKLYRGKYAAVWSENGRTHRVSLRTSDRGTAERRLKDHLRQSVGDTNTEIVESYLKDKEGVARSHEAMRFSWRALKPTFGHLRPDQITRQLCRSYAESRRRAGRRDGTIIKDLSLLRAALHWAKREKGADFELPSAPQPKERYLTREEFDRLLAGCRLPHIALFAVLALTTGARASAILDLSWDQVDFLRGQIRLSKGEARRKGRATVPMNDRARTALEMAAKGRTIDNVIEWAGRPVKSIRRAFREACGRAKLRGVTPHVLRHTAAVWMAEAGVPIPEIAQFLGHSDTRITYRVYSRFSPEHLQRAAAALN